MSDLEIEIPLSVAADAAPPSLLPMVCARKAAASSKRAAKAGKRTCKGSASVVL